MGTRYQWDSLKIPRRPVIRSHSDAGRGVPRGRGTLDDGTPGVTYDSQGRLFFPAEVATTHHFPSSSLPRDEAYSRRYERHHARDGNIFSFKTRPKPSPAGSRTIITKHYDNYRRDPNMDFRSNSGMSVGGDGFYRDDYVRHSGRSYSEGKSQEYVREGSLILEERIVSHERPWIWPMFMIAALLMFMLGILNILFCVDNHIWSLLWVPIFIVIFALIGALHKGIYRGSAGKWRNWLYIWVGILTTLAEFICCAYVVIRLTHVTIQITELSTDGFLTVEKLRMATFDEFPRVNLSDSLDTNIWACYAMDWVSMILLWISFAVLTSTIVIGNNFYNSNHDYGRLVEPFCKPAMFNPWAQVTAGQALAFVGIVLKAAAHGNYKIRWQDYWVPVWCAIFPILAGVFTALSLKRAGVKRSKLMFVGGFFQIVNLLAMVAGLGIITYTLQEVIKSYEIGTISTTLYSQGLLTASVFVFVAMDIMLLVHIIYALALLIRLVLEGKSSEEKKETRYEEERYEDRYRIPRVNPDHTMYPPVNGGYID